MFAELQGTANLDAKAKRLLLAELLERKSREKQYPASYTQEALWFINQINPIQTAFSMRPSIRIKGPVKIEIVERVLNEMLRRHEVLRTRFPERHGFPVQIVDPFVPRHFPLIDLSDRDEDEKRRVTRSLSLEQPAIDLRQDPVIGGTLVRWGNEDHILLLYVHHIIFDGWSLGVASREVAMMYEAFAAGRPSPLPNLPMQYGEFAIWQRRYLSGNRLRQLEDYWQHQLKGLQPLDLPTDRRRPPMRTTKGGTVLFNLSATLNRYLVDFAKREGVTLYMVLLAAFSEVLHRFTGATDIAVGTPVANRRRREFESMIGYFINMVVVRNDLSGDPGFAELVRRVQRTTMEGLDYQDLTLDRVVNKISPPRDLSRHPLFQVMFVLQNTPPPLLRVGDLSLERVPGVFPPGETIFDLTMEWLLEDGQLRGQLGYNSDLFARQSISRLADYYLRMLEAVLGDPYRPLSKISIMSEEVGRLLRAGTGNWRGSSPASSTNVTVLFKVRAASWPLALAVVESNRSLTYAQLDAWSDRLAMAIREQGAGPEVRVAVLLPRRLETIVVLMGILKAGAAYVPLDLGLPEERIVTILASAGPRILVTSIDQASKWQHPDRHLVAMDLGKEIPTDLIVTPLGDATQPNDLAYVIYTSGSTGTPKGVQIEHAALLNYCLAAIETYDLRPADRVLQFSAFSFDAHVEEVFPTLLAGGTLVLRDEAMMASLSAFSCGCESRAISVVSLPTGFWHEWTRALDSDNAVVPVGLRLVILGGEAVQPERIRAWYMRTKGQIRLVNSYGPTETTVVVTTVDLNSDHGEAYRPPIGRPLPGVRIKVVDRFGRLCPVGVYGELLIGGETLSRGYLGRDDLTEQVFFVDPADGQRWYRSGDRVRWRDDGLLEYVGRFDEQLKIRGFRVEPAEIEAALLEHPLIERALIIPLKTDAGSRLVAYLGIGDNQVGIGELRSYLKRRLPDFMIPARFIPMYALPLNSSCKVARDQLPEPDSLGGQDDVLQTGARPLEQRMIMLWQQILGIDLISRDDDFFELGGNSLEALRLVAESEQQFGVQLGLDSIFKESVLSRLVAQVEELLDTEQPRHQELTERRVWPLNKGHVGRPFFCLYGLGGLVTPFRELGRQLEPRPIYGVGALGLLGEAPLENSIAAMAESALVAIRETQTDGPYLLGGWSMGGWIATEIARRLRAAGEEVTLLALLDTPFAAQVTGAVSRLEALTGHLNRALTNTWIDVTERRLGQALRQYGIIGRVDQKLVKRMQTVLDTHRQALSDYQPAKYEGKAVLWSVKNRSVDESWFHVFPNLRVEKAGGDHFTMLKEPAVADLAASLNAYLRKSDTRDADLLKP